MIDVVGEDQVDPAARRLEGGGGQLGPGAVGARACTSGQRLERGRKSDPEVLGLERSPVLVGGNLGGGANGPEEEDEQRQEGPGAELAEVSAHRHR